MREYLLVDDNRAFAENLAEILSDANTRVTLAGAGAEALALARSRRFDAMVTDMRMPVMNGAQLVHEIRRVDPGLPAIVVTAWSQETDLADARHQGLLAVLPKPVPIAQLSELLAAARRDGVVAVVEDDPQLCDNLSELLRERGFTAVTAGSALDAERLGGLRPFAAIVDLKLPDSPNGEVLGRLASRFPGLPLLVVTGHRELLGDVPHAGLFAKPFDSAALLTALEEQYAGRAVA